MSWHVVYTKPREEFRAQENLENQGFNTYLPVCDVENIRSNTVSIKKAPLFSRYLFVNMDMQNTHWGVILSTKGVSQLLRMGNHGEPIAIPDQLIENLQSISATTPIQTKYQENDTVRVTEGPFKGFEGFYKRLLQAPSGEIRAMLLIEFLGKQQFLQVPVSNIKFVG